MRYPLFFCLIAFAVQAPLRAQGTADRFVPKLGSGQLLDLDQTDFINNEYQIGDEWGKKPVTASEISHQPALAHIAYGTARVDGATGFLLGKFAGKYVMATNHHVCNGTGGCRPGAAVKFPLLRKVYRVETFYGSWPEIDLSLFTITVDPADEASLQNASNPFAFDLPIRQGEPLATLGFGVAENPGRQLVGNWDSDCKVFSADGDYRLLRDPDEINPGTYQAWSFALGCDVSHGDSGSAIVDRESGRVIGIIWTGKIPKNEKVQSSAYLDQMLATQSPEIWTELSFAVPNVKIQSKLQELLNKEAEGSSFGLVLSAILHP